jgi:CheY-like chemotaxis protein
VVLADEDAARAVRALFEPAGYAVERSAGGQDAVARLRERRFEVVITDLSATGEDGTPFAIRVLEDPALRPPHVLVAAGDPVARSRLTEAGAVVVPYPFRPRDLAEVAGELLAARCDRSVAHPLTN